MSGGLQRVRPRSRLCSFGGKPRCRIWGARKRPPRGSVGTSARAPLLCVSKVARLGGRTNFTMSPSRPRGSEMISSILTRRMGPPWCRCRPVWTRGTAPGCPPSFVRLALPQRGGLVVLTIPGRHAHSGASREHTLNVVRRSRSRPRTPTADGKPDTGGPSHNSGIGVGSRRHCPELRAWRCTCVSLRALLAAPDRGQRLSLLHR